ncbi:PepSY domain-containing protein [Streptomyces sp. NPDC006997]|uniref:PepSY domain-containing protein n=1 Tax=Streptomyces sp. NPDC006997 TaxID=3155356 RepID=UPI0033E0C47C
MARTSRRPLVDRRGWRSVAPLLLTTGVLVAACDGPPPAHRPEVLRQVDATYDRAVRKALAEVPGAKLYAVGLRDGATAQPVWRAEVVAPDDSLRVVRVDASLGDVLGPTEPADRPPAERTRTAGLVSDAEVLPEDAVEKAAAGAVHDPHYGKVTGVRLARDRENRAVWSVTVAAIDPRRTRTYDVDAVTAEVVGSRTDGGDPARETAPAHPTETIAPRVR